MSEVNSAYETARQITSMLESGADYRFTQAVRATARGLTREDVERIVDERLELRERQKAWEKAADPFEQLWMMVGRMKPFDLTEALKHLLEQEKAT